MPGMENARDDKETFDDLGQDSLKAARPRREAPSEERRREMHASFNDRISHLCKLVALVIALVSFATIALGREMPRFVLMGLCLSVALLAIAMLQDHYQRKQ